MKIIRSSRPFFPEEDIQKISADISETLQEGMLRKGKNFVAFEKEVAEYLCIKSSVAMDSDSSALETALGYFNVKNREVAVCTNSFVSVPNSVLYAGGKVVFVDIGEDSLSMDPESLLANISKDTCGVIVTHIAGFPNPYLREIMDICRKHDLFLVEDATHAIGATMNGKKLGTFGDAGVFAFTPTKVLTTGEGGMLVTNNNDLAEFAKSYSYYGSGPGKTNFVNLGRHMMLPEISAIIGRHQLRRAEEFIAYRNKIAGIYDEAFEKTSLNSVKCSTGCRCSYYKYPLILDDRANKEKFTKMLFQDFGIETGTVFYPPCHLQATYQGLISKTRLSSLPVAERVLSKTITLPLHVAMTEQDANYVIDSIYSLITS